MQVWTSTESMIDIDVPLREARKELEGELAALAMSKDYGAGISKWALIFIIMDSDDPRYPEVRRYKKHSRLAEFRLKVDHLAFKNGDAVTQRELLADAFLRSIDLSSSLRIPDFDHATFKADVLDLLVSKGWVRFRDHAAARDSD